MNGDALARGARFATFGPAEKVSQEKWDAIWADDVVNDENPKVSPELKEFRRKLKNALGEK